jgi:phosphatidylethanolamine-binding protein (PEBP) family uncharacterized protein
MRTPATSRRPTLTALAIPLALLLAGCATATNTLSPARLAPITLTSPAIANHELPARYTCDGQNTNPPLTWGATPPNTSELLATLIGYQTSSNGTYTVTVEWALAGINPHLHHLNPGQRPPGSFPGLTTQNTRHYNLCPPKHTTHHYQIMLYSLPNPIKLSHEFDTLEILSAITKPGQETSATAQGTLPTTYTRN